jgi:uncharacterized protein YndB with AHSA1/START domain
MGNTVKIHRVIKAPVALVYQAFIDGDALAKWLPPAGFTCKVHHIDAKVGGTFRMSFAGFGSEHPPHSFGGEYLEMKPDELLRYTDVFDDPNLPGVLTVTVKLKAVACGTDVDIVQENIPEIIPLDGCYLGWQDSMNQLAAFVEGAAAMQKQ